MATMVDLLDRCPSHCVGAGYTFNTETHVLDLTVTAKRTDSYAVRELEVDPAFRGRAFNLGKLSAGTDGEAAGYVVFASARGPAHDSCECRGFAHKRRCKHVGAVRGLLSNGWV